VKNIPGRSLRDRLKRSRNLRSEGVFVNWCKRLGLNGNLVVQRATRAMALCFGRLALPFRVSLAVLVRAQVMWGQVGYDVGESEEIRGGIWGSQ
jgi:hypothetical protein